MAAAAPTEHASPEALRAFLKALYAPSVFNMKGGEWAGGGTYADMLVADHARRLRRYGASSVGRFVSASGSSIWFDAKLRTLPSNPLRMVRRPSEAATQTKARGASTRSRRR